MFGSLKEHCPTHHSVLIWFTTMHNAFSYLLIVSIISILGCQPSQDEQLPFLNIIPQPKELIFDDGQFEINTETQLIYKGLDKVALHTIKSFNQHFSQASGYELTINDQTPAQNYILFQIQAIESSSAEAYELVIEPTHIQIIAVTNKGLFYALQTLRQLLPNVIERNIVNNATKWILPSLQIKDFPEFEYRGLNLDVARHYFPVEFIKKQLDLMALYRLNVFHWHLTDDQGWRIEIKKYPKLTSIGAKRSKTLIGHGANPPFKYDNTPYMGYYTQENIKEIIAYAQERHIQIIPEIEMPGHALAALASYPELGCTGGPYEVATHWGVFEDVMCPGKESTFTIIKDILSEVAALFPGEYIHIGGDECTKTKWRNCKHCQKRINNLGINNESELENYFIKRTQGIVSELGKKMVGWNEIMSDSTLADATIIMWQDDANYKNAIKNNNEIVKSSNNYLYFDHYQAAPQDHPLAIGGYTPLKDVYHYKVYADNEGGEAQQSIIGIQANCWTEYMATEDKVEFMLYPRLQAFSEVAWGNENKKDWPEFRRKLESHLERLNILGVNYYYEVPKPVANSENLNFIHPTTLGFKSISDKYSIRYTTDGSEPNVSSRLYNDPIPVNLSGTIKAITILNATGEQSKIAIFNLNQLEFQKPVDAEDIQSGLKCKVYKGRFKTVKEIKNTNLDKEIILMHSFIPDSIYRESFGLILNGYFKAEEKGIYEFELNSDDGSALYIGDDLVVNNDGIHGSKAEKGAIALREGYYPITLYYFQTTGYSQFNLNVIDPINASISLKPADFFN